MCGSAVYVVFCIWRACVWCAFCGCGCGVCCVLCLVYMRCAICVNLCSMWCLLCVINVVCTMCEHVLCGSVPHVLVHTRTHMYALVHC